MLATKMGSKAAKYERAFNSQAEPKGQEEKLGDLKKSFAHYWMIYLPVLSPITTFHCGLCNQWQC